jgi:hypothetical protein
MMLSRQDIARLMCRFLGHDVSRTRIQRDAQTFEEFSVCKRCGSRLKRDAGAWKAEPPPPN